MDFREEQLVRYSRNILVDAIGGAGQEKLLAAKVLVIGAGGIGSPLLYYLAAAGIGTIGIVDNDVVELSNLQRQILHNTASIHLAKTDSAVASLKQLNPEIIITPHTVRLSTENAEAIMAPYDIIADGCDNADTRFLVQKICYRLQKTLISASVLGFKGQVATFKPTAENAPCYGCLYSPLLATDSLITCTESGVLGAVTGVVGSIQATEVVKEIIGQGQGLAGYVMTYDGLQAQFRKIRLPRDPACPICSS